MSNVCIVVERDSEADGPRDLLTAHLAVVCRTCRKSVTLNGSDEDKKLYWTVNYRLVQSSSKRDNQRNHFSDHSIAKVEGFDIASSSKIDWRTGARGDADAVIPAPTSAPALPAPTPLPTFKRTLPPLSEPWNLGSEELLILILPADADSDMQRNTHQTTGCILLSHIRARIRSTWTTCIKHCHMMEPHLATHSGAMSADALHP